MTTEEKLEQLKEELQAKADRFNQIKDQRDQLQQNLAQLKEELIGLDRSVKEFENFKGDNQKVDDS